MSASIEMTDLGGRDLGKTITIPTPEGDVTGLLVEIEQRIANEDVAAYAGERIARAISLPYTTVTLHGWQSRGFWGDTSVFVHEEPAA